MAQLIMIVVILMISGVSEASSRKAALSVELLNLGRSIKHYHLLDGRFPQTWDELERISPGLDHSFSILKPTIRIMLISPPFELPENNGGGMALAITREPLRPKAWTQVPFLGISYEYFKDPSYAIIVSKDDGIFVCYAPPNMTRSIFEAKNIPLPEPSGLGPFPYERELMIRRIISWSLLLVAGLGLIWRIIRNRKNLRSVNAA